MDINKPRFELTSIYSDGTAEKPRIVPINEMPLDTNTSRRGFLGAGLVAGAALTLLGKSNLFAGTTSSIDLNENYGEKIIYAHSNSILALTISPDGKMLASGSMDETIKLWSLPDGKLLKTLRPNSKSVDDLSISPDGKILASASGRQLKLWSIPDGNLLKTLEGHSNSVFALSINPDGKILASGSADKTIKLWSIPDGNLLKTIEGHTDYVSTLSISPDGKILISRSYDKAIKLWSLPDGSLLKTLKRINYKYFFALCMSPDGSIIAFGSRSDSIELHSLPEGKSLKNLDGHSNAVCDLFISLDGKKLASGSWDKTIKLWSMPDGSLLKTFEGHSEHVYSVCISPDSKMLVSGSKDRTIRLWDLEKMEFISFLFDPACNEEKGVTYNIYDKVTNTTITYTLPCGSPIPVGAVCTCNCVAGTYRVPTYSSPSYQNTICTCNRVCTCIPVCQAHKLLHPDKLVRMLSREILLFMGIKELEYMNWAANNSKTKLKSGIVSLIKEIKKGIKPDSRRWPAIHECTKYLKHNDEVVSVMAAQMIYLQSELKRKPLAGNLNHQVSLLLAKSRKMYWKNRV